MLEDLAHIGARLAEARKSANLSQTELAVRSHVSRATIDALENGRSGDIGFSKLNRILAVVGLALDLQSRPDRRPTLDQLLTEGADD